MDYILSGLKEAFYLILSLDEGVFSAVWTSLKVSVTAIIFATIVSLPAGFLVSTKDFKYKGLFITFLNTLMAVPTVVIGLIVYSFISHQGPLGMFNLLYTPWAMIMGQFLIAVPILSSLMVSAIQSVDEKISQTALTLGATSSQVAITIFLEARFGLLAAVMAGFGRIIGEVGSAMILGGNIKGYTRTMSTAIALQTSMGEFSTGIALGIILLLVAFIVNFLLHYLQKR